MTFTVYNFYYIGIDQPGRIDELLSALSEQVLYEKSAHSLRILFLWNPKEFSSELEHCLV